MTKQLPAGLALALCLAGCGLLPITGDPVQILTGDPLQGGCFAADVGGLLVADPTYGTAIVPQAGVGSMVQLGDVPMTVAWRPGFTARRSGSEVEVLDPEGHVVAITGRSYTFSGGYANAGGDSGIARPGPTTQVIWACGDTQPLPEASRQSVSAPEPFPGALLRHRESDRWSRPGTFDPLVGGHGQG